MDDLENKLGAILGDPGMMQKIMSLAQSFESKQDPPPPSPDNSSAGLGDIDMGMVQKLSGLMHQSGIDKNQQNLLHALIPYLSQVRIRKLERAMRAAKMATMAGSLFGSGQFLWGR